MKRDIDIFCKLLLLFCFIAIASKAAAYTFEQGGIYYFTSGNMAVVTFKDTDYDSYSGHVTVPASVPTMALLIKSRPSVIVPSRNATNSQPWICLQPSPA